MFRQTDEKQDKDSFIFIVVRKTNTSCAYAFTLSGVKQQTGVIGDK